MNPDPIESAGLELFGESWKGAMARALDVSPTTLDRQRGRDRPRGPVLAALAAWLLLKRTFSILPPEKPTGHYRSTTGATIFPSVEEADWTAFVRETGAQLFDGKKSRVRLAVALGLDAVSLWRQTEQSSVTGPVLATLRAWMLIRMLIGTRPPAEPYGPWDLPELRVEPKRRTRSKYADLLGARTDEADP